jgi:hypothetical protein
MNLQGERLTRLPTPIKALIEPTEQKLSELEYIATEARQELYLNAWRSFYTSCPNYLFPTDRAAVEDEFGPRRTEDVSTQSYENTKHAVQQNRENVLQANKGRLDSVLLTATDTTTYRNKLARECHNTVKRLDAYADVFTDLDAQSYSPCLPLPGFWPERKVDEPAQVGAALGLLDFLKYAHAHFWANEASSTSDLPEVAGIAASLQQRFDTSPPTLQKIRFCNGFSPEDADRVALEIELIDDKGNYTGLRGVAPGRLCGFYKTLRDEQKVSGNLEILRDYFAERYLKRPVPSKPAPNTYIAQNTATETKTALNRLFLK